MRNFKEIICRANIQELCSFLLDGIELSNWCAKPDIDNYEERLKKGEEPLWEFIENLYPDRNQKDNVYDIICEAILINQEVYMELGILLGANLILEIFQSNPLKEPNDNEKS